MESAVAEGLNGRPTNLELPTASLIDSPACRQILVLDDPASCQLISLLLGKEYECLATQSPRLAAEAVERETGIELVLMDWLTAGNYAVHVIDGLRRKRPDVAVVMMSATPDVEEAQKSFRSGAWDYLKKPLTRHELTAAVERACLDVRSVAAKRAAAYGLCQGLRLKDRETRGHCDRVVGFSLHLGAVLGLKPRQIFELEMGSLLHDIGKLAVEDNVLRKPAALDAVEWVEMRKHPIIGEKMLLECGFSRPVAAVAGQHHEQWGGGGYPRHLKGEEIELLARIFSVSDAVDAITSDRVYRRARSFEVARREIETHAGSQFDPMVVAAFMSVSNSEWQSVRERAEQNELDTQQLASCG